MKRVFFGGNILTMNNRKKAEAILVENGTIKLLGAPYDFTHTNVEAVDLKGATLMPSFIDAHSHFSQVAVSQSQTSLENAATREDIIRLIHGNSAGPEKWLIAYGFAPESYKGSPIDLCFLDELSKSPLVIQNLSGHSGYFNSAALASCGISYTTPDPAGGTVGRAEGKLTGYLEENAYIEALKKLPLPSADTLIKAYIKTQDLYASYGITTIQDGLVTSEMLPLYRLLSESRVLYTDIVAYPQRQFYEAYASDFDTNNYNAHIRVGGIKLLLDGSPQQMTAWMRSPYRDGSYGYGTMSDNDVADALVFAGEHRAQVLAHCNGDAAARQYIDCMRRAQRDIPRLRQLRPVMIHAQFLAADQLQAVRELGIIPSFFIGHVYYFSHIHMQNIDRQKVLSMSPLASCVKAGIPFTLHQDTPVTPPCMLKSIESACTRLSISGETIGADERIDAYTAMQGVTTNVAYQYMEEGSKGRISNGMRADLVILDKDPLRVPSKELSAIRVLQTIKDGNTIYEA